MTTPAKIDPALALGLWNSGLTKHQIADALCPSASTMAVYRAIRRAVRAGGVAKHSIFTYAPPKEESHEPPSPRAF